MQEIRFRGLFGGWWGRLARLTSLEGNCRGSDQHWSTDIYSKQTARQCQRVLLNYLFILFCLSQVIWIWSTVLIWSKRKRRINFYLSQLTKLSWRRSFPEANTHCNATLAVGTVLTVLPAVSCAVVDANAPRGNCWADYPPHAWLFCPQRTSFYPFTPIIPSPELLYREDGWVVFTKKSLAEMINSNESFKIMHGKIPAQKRTTTLSSKNKSKQHRLIKSFSGIKIKSCSQGGGRAKTDRVQGPKTFAPMINERNGRQIIRAPHRHVLFDFCPWSCPMPM